MRTIVIIAICLVALFALILGFTCLIGSRLPVSHSATRSILLHRPADEIYRLVRDVASAPTWRSDVTSVELVGEVNGKLNYREHGKQGDVTYEIFEEIPGERIVTRIVDTDLGYSGKWTTVFKSEAGGTRVMITEDGEVSNVLFRFMSHYVFAQTSTIDAYLNALAKRFGENVQPQ